MNDPASRFKLVAEATMAPGACWITRTQRGPLIDTGVTVKFGEFGRIYLSVDAIREMAQNAGLFDNMESISSPDRELEAEQRGYDRAVRENIGGDLHDLVARLGDIADRISGGPAVADVPAAPEPVDPEPARDRDIDEPGPLSFVTFDGIAGEEPAGAHGDAEDTGEPGGQGDGAVGDDRPALVPAGPSDDNPFRI